MAYIPSQDLDLRPKTRHRTEAKNMEEENLDKEQGERGQNNMIISRLPIQKDYSGLTKHEHASRCPPPLSHHVPHPLNVIYY